MNHITIDTRVPMASSLFILFCAKKQTNCLLLLPFIIIISAKGKLKDFTQGKRYITSYVYCVGQSQPAQVISPAVYQSQNYYGRYYLQVLFTKLSPLTKDHSSVIQKVKGTKIFLVRVIYNIITRFIITDPIMWSL